MPGKCKFQSAWLSNDDYKLWVAPDTANPHCAKCTRCRKTFDIASMGESALKSHAKSAKHCGIMQMAAGNSMENYLAASVSGRSTGSAPSQATDLNSACKSHEVVTDAEILWTMKVITSHYSYRSSAQTGDLFKRMFPDSDVAKSFSCGEKKCAYVACHGLRPFFLSRLQQEVQKSDYYVVLFDESGNDFLQEKQMDVHVRYWDSSHKVATRYYTSAFMGHSTAEDIQEVLLRALEPLPLGKIIQISMDGPNVNLKFFRNMQVHLQEHHQVQCVDLGTCGLHTIHNAFRAGVVASKWGIDILLTSLSALFRDSPARREDFSTVTNQDTFPLHFVAHRWVENTLVIERALLLWNDVKKYVESARSKQVSLPKCASFENVYSFCRDPLTPAKLNFALSVASILQPFLKDYQSDKPMIFFLGRDLESVVRKLLVKFMKASVLSSLAGVGGLLRVDVDNPNNHTALDEVDIGPKCVQALKDSRASAKDAFQFRMECKQFLAAVTKKILERSPLKSSMVRNLSSLDPRLMCSKPDQCLVGIRKVLDVLTMAGRLSDCQRVCVLAEYTELLQEFKHELRMFERSISRLDEFFRDLLCSNPSYKELWNAVRLLLVLSHGQATVERGFSVNRQISVENLKGLSYISQRIICDAVERAGGILNVPISKELRVAVSAARQHYSAHLESQKKQCQENSQQTKRQKIMEEVEGLQMKKKKLEAVVADLTASADEYAEKAEATADIKKVVKSNSLRKTARAKAEELSSVKTQLANKLKDLT